jgi:uncharacterized protein (TIGR03067 family)
MNAFVVGLGLVLGAPALKEGPKPDASPVGEWTVVESLLGGKSDGVMQRAPIDKIVITADRWVVVRKGQESGGAPITFDSKADPPHLDFVRDAPGSGTKGVYKLDGDTLTVCYILGGDQRPEKVESPPGSQVRLMTLKRIKK